MSTLKKITFLLAGLLLGAGISVGAITNVSLTKDHLLQYLNYTTDSLVVGATGTTTNAKLEVNGMTTSLNFTATSTSASSTLPLLETTQIKVGSLSGIVKAVNGILRNGATTDDLTEGVSNLYFTNGRARSAVAGLFPATTTINTWSALQNFSSLIALSSSTIQDLHSDTVNATSLALTGTASLSGFTNNGGGTTTAFVATQQASTSRLTVSNTFSFGGVTGTAWSSFCTSITGSADLCDGNDAGGGGSGASSTLLSDGNNWSALQNFIAGANYNGWRISTTTTVCASGCQYTSIQTALNAGYKNISLKEETYAGPVLIDADDVTIKGAGMYSSIISCNGATNGQCVAVATTTPRTRITLQDFGILNTNASRVGVGLTAGDATHVKGKNIRINNFLTAHSIRDIVSQSFYHEYEGMIYFDVRNGMVVNGTLANHHTSIAPQCRVEATETNGICYDFTNAEGWTLINPGSEPGANKVGTAFRVDGTSIGITAISPWFEQNATGTEIQSGALNVSIIGGGRITANTIGFWNRGSHTVLSGPLVSSNTTNFDDTTKSTIYLTTDNDFSTAFIGVGTSTQKSADTRLTLSGSFSTVNEPMLIISNEGAFAAANSGIQFTNQAVGANFPSGIANILVTPGSGFTNASMRFTVADSNKTVHERFTLDTNGNIGIGSSTPSARLGVNGNILADSIRATSTTATSSFSAPVEMKYARITDLVSCTLITSDSNGNLHCGSGGTSASSTLLSDGNNWSGLNRYSAGIISSASSTFQFVNLGNATSTNFETTQIKIGTLSGVLKASNGGVTGSASTSDLPEGSNSYWTSLRATTSVSSLIAGTTTTALAEGSNLYYTAQRVRDLIQSAGTLLVSTTTAQSWNALQTFTTISLTSGTSTSFATTQATSSVATISRSLDLNWLATGLLKVTNGSVGLATAGTDYENPLSFGALLSRSGNTISGSTSPSFSALFATSTTVASLINYASTTAITTTATSTMADIFSSGLGAFARLSWTGTSTGSNGINITSGCFSINNVCVGGGTVSGSQTPWTSNIDAAGFSLSGLFGITSSSTSATSTIAGVFAVGTSTPSASSLFTVGTSSPLISVNKRTGKVGFGSDNLTPARWSFGAGDNLNVNPNINLLVQDPADARLGVSVSDNGLFMKAPSSDTSSAGLFAFNYQAGTAMNLNLSEFGGNVGISTSSPYAKLSVAGPVVAEYFTATSTATSTFRGVRADCFSVDGVNCLGAAGGSYSGTGSSGQVVYWTGASSFSGSNNFVWDSTNNQLSIGTSTSVHRLKVVGRISGQPQFDCSVLMNTITAVVADQLGTATVAPTLCNGNMGWDMLGTTDGRLPALTAALNGYVASGTPNLQTMDVGYTAPNNGNEGGYAKSQALLGSATSSGGIAMELWIRTPNVGTATTSLQYFAGFSGIEFTSTTTSAAVTLNREACIFTATSTASWQLMCRKNNVVTMSDTGFATSTTAFKVLLTLDQTGFSAYINNDTTPRATISAANVPTSYLRGVLGALTLSGISTALGTGAMQVGRITVWESDY